MRYKWRAAAALVSAIFAVSVLGGDAPAQAPQESATSQERAAQEARSPLQAAALIRDLIAGRLAADVDPDSLFQTSLGSESVADARLLLTLLHDRAVLARARRGEDFPGVSPERVELAVARADFLLLAPRRRATLLEAHQVRVERAAGPALEASRKQQTLAALTAQVDGLEAFLAGEPADPGALSIDLLDPAEAALQSDRRAATLAAPEGEVAPPAPEDDAIEARIARARARVDALRSRVLALAPEAFAQLLDAQSSVSRAAMAAEVEAAEAARLAQEARAEAERAATETLRLLAQERGRLLSVRQAQAEFAAVLARRGQVSNEMSETTLRARREVRELEERPALATGRDADANRLYDEVVVLLRDVRGRLSSALSANDAPPQNIEWSELDPDLPEGDPSMAELQRMNEELRVEANRLREQNVNVRWQERTAFYDAMTALNDARLSLIPALTSDKRSRVVGFGDQGIDQVGREINQIVLTARYNLAFAPQRTGQLLRPLLNPTPRLLFALLQLIVLTIAFRYWRRSGETILIRAEQGYARRRPPTVVSASAATALGVYRDIRRPAEWLALVLLLRWAFSDTLGLGGVGILWTTLIWLLVAALLVQLANSLVRTRSGQDLRAELRLKSLRLLAGVGAGVGLILSLTADLVGVGAIHHWVLSACWLLVPPIAFLLAEWWRERILTLAKAGASSHAVLAWAARNDKGALGRVSGVVAGAFLLSQGLSTLAAHRMNDIALIREISDQRSRAKAAAQAAADIASGQYKPIAADTARTLDPNRAPASPDPTERSPDARILPDLAIGKVTAITGEHGLGKSTALTDLQAKAAKTSRFVRVQASGPSADLLLASLALQVGSAANVDAIAEALATGPATIVAVDDVQRLIMPAIGGLASFERLLSLAQKTSANTGWYFAIGDQAMTYLGRVRADRALFDEIIALPRWESGEIRALVERRTEQAGLAPVFQEIHAQALSLTDTELPREERHKRAYFEHLTDYCDGNPALALEFWRRSLYENCGNGQTEVRTFSPPPASELLALPGTTVFILRAILQMEVADLASIQKSTDLSPVVVSAALRKLERMGAVAPVEQGHAITLYWHREVVRILQSQNLISRPHP